MTYLAGVAEMMMMAGFAYDDLQKEPTASGLGAVYLYAACHDPINGYTMGAVVQAFLNWTTAHPEKWAQPRIFGATAAIRETWPCSGGNNYGRIPNVAAPKNDNRIPNVVSEPPLDNWIPGARR
jgi:Rap1a immunity proteins